MGKRVSLSKMDYFNVEVDGSQMQEGNGGGESESERAGAAGVDVPDSGAKLLRRCVAVAADDSPNAGGRGIEVELIDVVEHVEDGVLDFDDLGFWQALCPGVFVGIAADCGDRGDGCERFENVRSADVAGVDDAVGVAESFERLGSEETVGVGDQADGNGAAGHSFNVAGAKTRSHECVNAARMSAYATSRVRTNANRLKPVLPQSIMRE
jgi:hypothetical protein